MRALLAAATLVALAVSAKADVMPKIPTEEEKIAALKMAYVLNGNSMQGYGRMIDLSREFVPPPGTVRTIPIQPTEKKNERRR